MNLDKYLQRDTVNSAMRLMAFMVVTTGCIVALCIGFAVVYSLIMSRALSWDLAALLVADSTFIGVGLAGKYQQKKVEASTDQNMSNNALISNTVAEMTEPAEEPCTDPIPPTKRTPIPSHKPKIPNTE